MFWIKRAEMKETMSFLKIGTGLLCRQVAVLLVALALTEAALFPELSELENCTATCSTPSPALSNIFDRSDLPCYCDEHCSSFGDCCRNDPQRFTPSAPHWACVQYNTESEGTWARQKCQVNWPGDYEIKRKCESGGSVADPVGNAPVTSRKTHISYLNANCAVCNDDYSDLAYWNLSMNCENIWNAVHERTKINETYSPREVIINERYVQEHIHYNPQKKAWGIWHKFQDESPVFLTCSLHYRVRNILRTYSCLPIVSDCDPHWTDENDIEQCRSYRSIVGTGYTTYRNVHCAICSNATSVDRLHCGYQTYRSQISPRGFVFSVLMDVNSKSGSIVGQETRCKDTEVFDPFYKKCRNIVCGIPGYILKDKKCVQSNNTVATNNTAISEAVSYPPSENPQNVLSTTASPEQVDPERSNFSTTLDPPRPTSEIHSDSSASPTSSTASTVSTSVKPTHDPSNNTKVTTQVVYNREFLECGKTYLEKEDYVLFPNKSIYVQHYDKVFPLGSYATAEDASVLVCLFFINETSSKVPKFSVYMSYVSAVGLGISITCLVLHLIVFLVVPDMRNFSGKNLASLSVALLAAYLCFIFGQLSVVKSAQCVYLAISSYYFFLASFFWMNVMSFDVWRTLRMATKELRVSSGSQWKRFLAYSFYCWFLPCVVIGLSLGVENMADVPTDFRPAFGEYNCWFGHRKALLVFFAGPVGFLMLFNLLFFILSAIMIVNTTKTTAKNQSKSSRRNFRLYLRLSVMMGLSWTTGLIAGYLDIEILWYFFIIFNTLQGLFIFAAFSCTPKVGSYLRERISVVKTSAYRSSSCNSGSAFNSNSTGTTHSGISRRGTSPRSSTNYKHTAAYLAYNNNKSNIDMY